MTNKQIMGLLILLVLFIGMITTEARQRTKEECDQMLNDTELSLRIGDREVGRNFWATWTCYKAIGIEHPEYLEKGIQLTEEDYEKRSDTEPARNMGEIYMSLAAIYNDSSYYDSAIEWYLKSCEYERRINYNCAFEYAKISICYILKGDTENACKWCEESNKESPKFMDCATDFTFQNFPKTTHCGYSPDNSESSSSSGGSSSGFDVSSLLIPAGFLLVLVVLSAFFLVGNRNQKKMP